MPRDHTHQILEVLVEIGKHKARPSQHEQQQSSRHSRGNISLSCQHNACTHDSRGWSCRPALETSSNVLPSGDSKSGKMTTRVSARRKWGDPPRQSTELGRSEQRAHSGFPWRLPWKREYPFCKRKTSDLRKTKPVGCGEVRNLVTRKCTDRTKDDLLALNFYSSLEESYEEPFSSSSKFKKFQTYSRQCHWLLYSILSCTSLASSSFIL